jgi:hypothetical protein
MKYKLPDYPNPSLVEIADENDVEILARMEHDKDDKLYHIAKRINDVLFSMLWNKKNYHQHIALAKWIDIMRRVGEDKHVPFFYCFNHSIFEKTYFGLCAFEGTKSDMEIIHNRDEFIRLFLIEVYCRVKKVAGKRFDHFESYKTRNGKIICVVSNYTDDVPPEPFTKFDGAFYHPNATTYIARFENKIEYNKWRKELINDY